MQNYEPRAYCVGLDVHISGVEHFGLKETFDCGQAFRWQEIENDRWSGFALGRYIEIGKKQGEIILYNTSLEEYSEKWKYYLDINRDYGSIIKILSENEILKNAANKNKGIRILRQEPWETLCSFIISQNNNIPRIKGIIGRLCEKFGEKCEGGYSFPTAERIAECTVEDLADLRAGFRARYIIDAAQKYRDKKIDLELIKTADTDTAREELKKIVGVGDKVADCTLLFGFGRIDALPKDVWIKRALNEYFNGALPSFAEPYAGIAQQYIFNYVRSG